MLLRNLAVVALAFARVKLSEGLFFWAASGYVTLLDTQLACLILSGGMSWYTSAPNSGPFQWPGMLHQAAESLGTCWPLFVDPGEKLSRFFKRRDPAFRILIHTPDARNMETWGAYLESNADENSNLFHLC